MKYLVLLLLTGFIGLCSAPAFADTSLVWSPPTERVDGTAFTVAEIARYELCANTSERAGCTSPMEVASNIEQVPLTDLVSDYEARYFSIRVVDTEGQASQWSEALLGKLLAPPSSPFLRIQR